MDSMNVSSDSNVTIEKIVTEQKPLRGFAAMDPAKVREIASLGGKRAHELGVAHQFTSEKARQAGSIGGKAFHKSRGRTPIVRQDATDTNTKVA